MNNVHEYMDEPFADIVKIIQKYEPLFSELATSVQITIYAFFVLL